MPPQKPSVKTCRAPFPPLLWEALFPPRCFSSPFRRLWLSAFTPFVGRTTISLFPIVSGPLEIHLISSGHYSRPFVALGGTSRAFFSFLQKTPPPLEVLLPQKAASPPPILGSFFFQAWQFAFPRPLANTTKVSCESHRGGRTLTNPPFCFFFSFFLHYPEICLRGFFFLVGVNVPQYSGEHYLISLPQSRTGDLFPQTSDFFSPFFSPRRDSQGDNLGIPNPIFS